MWHGRTVSVILPTYNEKDSIRQSIEDIVALGVADEVLVINNNAAPGTRRSCCAHRHNMPQERGAQPFTGLRNQRAASISR